LESDRPRGRLTEIGIVGAGLAGTTLAIALKQSGLAVRLYDQATDTADETPLTLTANGTRVLHAIGLKDVLADFAVFPQFATIRHARTAFLLSQRPLGAFSEARYGAPDCVVAAGSLTGALRRQAADLHIPLETGVPVDEVSPGSATVRLNDGVEHTHLALAVAAGTPWPPESPGLSNLLNDRPWRTPDEYRLLRAVGTRAEPSRDHDRFLNTWIADGLVVVEQPLNTDPDTQRIALTIVTPPGPDDGDPAVLLRELLAPTHHYLRELLVDPEVEWIPGPFSDCAEFWFAEKLAVLGGACHACPAFPEIAPSAALEDAWILSRMMERWEDSPHEGLSDYERFRKPRARRLRAYSDAERARLMVSDPLRSWQRNIGWSLTSRFLPEIAMQKTDWLYGYDCIKGFV